MSEARILTARCRECGKQLQVKTHQTEKTVRCPTCGCEVTATSEGTAALPGRPRPPELRPADPRALTPAEARAIIRPIAQKHGAKGILKQLDGVNDAKASKAVESYAGDLAEGEAPLLIIDTSFLQNGSSGLLLTNRHLFFSAKDKPIPLAEVLSSAYERPTLLEISLRSTFGIFYFLFGGEKLADRLVVNGVTVYEQGKINFKSWVEALVALGNASRKLGVEAGLVRRMQLKKRLVRHVAGAIASGLTDHEIHSRFQAVNAPPETVDQLVTEMRTIHGRRKRWPAVGATLGGAGVAGLFVALGLTSDVDWLMYIFALLCGVPLFCVGVSLLVTGPPPMRTQPLIDAWNEEYE